MHVIRFEWNLNTCVVSTCACVIHIFIENITVNCRYNHSVIFFISLTISHSLPCGILNLNRMCCYFAVVVAVVVVVLVVVDVIVVVVTKNCAILEAISF